MRTETRMDAAEIDLLDQENALLELEVVVRCGPWPTCVNDMDLGGAAAVSQHHRVSNQAKPPYYGSRNGWKNKSAK